MPPTRPGVMKIGRFVKHVSPLMTAKALDEAAASKFGGSYERGGSGGNEAEAVDGSVYAAKANY